MVQVDEGVDGGVLAVVHAVGEDQVQVTVAVQVGLRHVLGPQGGQGGRVGPEASQGLSPVDVGVDLGEAAREAVGEHQVDSAVPVQVAGGDGGRPLGG